MQLRIDGTDFGLRFFGRIPCKLARNSLRRAPKKVNVRACGDSPSTLTTRSSVSGLSQRLLVS
jgi:hypothetical protein